MTAVWKRGTRMPFGSMTRFILFFSSTPIDDHLFKKRPTVPNQMTAVTTQQTEDQGTRFKTRIMMAVISWTRGYGDGGELPCLRGLRFPQIALFGRARRAGRGHDIPSRRSRR